MPVVIFRYDDYHADRGAKEASKSQIERRLLDIFSRHQVPLTMGVVPNVAEDYETPDAQRYFPLADDHEKLNALKAAIARGVVEPALHGWQHQNNRTLGNDRRQQETTGDDGKQHPVIPYRSPSPPLPSASQRNSEFMGLQFEEQLRKIEQGKRALEEWLETPIVSFIPPWNTYDEQTVRALDAVHIRALSASLSTVPHESGLSTCQGEATALVYLPRTCALSEFDDALKEARKVQTTDHRPRDKETTGQRSGVRSPVVIVMMFHHFSFFDSDDALARQYANVSLEQLESIVARCARDETIETLSIGETARRYQNQLCDGRFAAAVQYDDCLRRLSHKRYVGKRLARRYPHRAYYPVEFYHKRLKWLQILTDHRTTRPQDNRP